MKPINLQDFKKKIVESDTTTEDKIIEKKEINVIKKSNREMDIARIRGLFKYAFKNLKQDEL